MKKFFTIAWQIGVLWLVFQLGNFFVTITKIPVPGNVAGMLIMFGLLSSGVLPVRLIEEGAAILLKHLAFFFIPIAVGLMAWGDLFAKHGVWLALALAVSAGLAITVTGLVVQKMEGRRNNA